MRIDRIKLITEMARAEIGCGELAKQAGVSRATVSAVKGGKTCSMTTAVKLSGVLGVQLERILEG